MKTGRSFRLFLYKNKGVVYNMGVFDSFTIEGDKIISTRWVEWIHTGIPDEAGAIREQVRKSVATKHCMVCTSMDACFYPDNNKPDLPQHSYCDCYVKKIDYDKVRSLASVVFPIQKLTDYLFNEKNPNNKGKAALFNLWGFTIDDSKYLKDSLSKQALEKYLSGDFLIKGNHGFGTIVKIKVSLNGRSWGTGWMIQPRGQIRNLTPYADNI